MIELRPQHALTVLSKSLGQTYSQVVVQSVPGSLHMRARYVPRTLTDYQYVDSIKMSRSCIRWYEITQGPTGPTTILAGLIASHHARVRPLVFKDSRAQLLDLMALMVPLTGPQIS